MPHSKKGIPPKIAVCSLRQMLRSMKIDAQLHLSQPHIPKPCAICHMYKQDITALRMGIRALKK